MRIRVLTLNVWNREGAKGRTAAINAELHRLQPDLIAFQEVMRSADDDQLAELTGGLGFRTTHQADMQGYTPPFAERLGGTAVATRWPHRRLEAIDLRSAGAGDVP